MFGVKRENLFLIANRSLLYGKLIAPGEKACVRVGGKKTKCGKLNNCSAVCGKGREKGHPIFLHQLTRSLVDKLSSIRVIN